MSFKTSWVLAACAALAALSTGCSSSWQSSALAPSGKEVYVVGMKQGFLSADGKIWLCPIEGQATECKPVEVVEQ